MLNVKKLILKLLKIQSPEIINNAFTSTYCIHSQSLVRFGKLGFFQVELTNNNANFPVGRITAFTLNTAITGTAQTIIRTDIQGNSANNFESYMAGIACGTFFQNNQNAIVDLHVGYIASEIKSLQICGIIIFN